MVLTVTEDTPADMLAGSMELLVQLPRDHHLHTQRVTVLRSTPMMDLLVQIATAHKLTASSYTLQAIGERGLVLPHHPNTPIGALDALQVKLLPKQVTCMPRKIKQTNQPFETTFRLQVHLPRNQLYVSRVSPKMNLGEILDEVCREKNLDRNKYELRHPANLEETLDLALSLQDYHLQEVTLYAKQTRSLGPTLSTQDIMALQRQEERRRQQTKQSVFGFMFKKSKESSLSTDSLGGRSVSPARSDETGRSASPLQPPTRPQRKRRPAPKPPADAVPSAQDSSGDSSKDKMVINHSRNSSDSSGYHEASVLSDNPDSAARLPETLPRRSKAPGTSDPSRKLAHTSQSSKSLSNLAATSGGTLSRGISSTSLSSAGLRKKRAAPPPPAPRPLSSAISTQALERIVDSEESLTSDIDPSKSPSDIGAPSKAGSDIDCPKANSDIGVSTNKPINHLDYKPKQETATCESGVNIQQKSVPKTNSEACARSNTQVNCKLAKADSQTVTPVEAATKVEQARVTANKVGESAPLPKLRKISTNNSASEPPTAPKRKVVPPLAPPRTLSTKHSSTSSLSRGSANPEYINEARCTAVIDENTSRDEDSIVALTVDVEEIHSESNNECTVSRKDELNQRGKISETVNVIVAQNNISLRAKTNLDHEKEINFESRSNPIEPICVNVEEICSRSREKSSNEDGLSQEEKLLETVGNPEDRESLEQEHDRNSALYSNSTELSIPSKRSLSPECEVIEVEKENSFSEQNHEMNTKINGDLYDQTENRRDNLYTSLDGDHSLNGGTVEPDRMTKQRNGQLELPQQTVCQRPPRVPREMVCICTNEENIEAVKHVHSEDATSGKAMKGDLERDKEACTVISTIPKCDYLDAIKENSILNVKRGVALANHQQLDKSAHPHIDCTVENMDEQVDRDHLSTFESNHQSEESMNNIAKNGKRTKVFRSQSKSDDFETDSLMRQRRYLTSPPEDIVYALNMNLPARHSDSSHQTEKEQEQIAMGHCTKCTRDSDVDKGESYGGLVTVAKEDTPSETDILLQKVSDTLSSTLPTSLSPAPDSPLPESNCATASAQAKVADIRDNSSTKLEAADTQKESNKICKSCVDFPVENTLSSSTPNVTVRSQQNTSDYVSAMSEDLSISDWEYQLPAPPSAFRDTHSPVFDGYDTITLGSVEAFKEPLMEQISEPADATDSCKKNVVESARNLSDNPEMNKRTSKTKLDGTSSKKAGFVSEAEIDIKRVVAKPIVKQTFAVSRKSEDNTDLRKEIISELETKIETGTLSQSVNKEFDRRNIDSVSAPKIAPVDNTLSNFTITTYTKHKSLDIFDELEEPSAYARNSDQRFIKTFATLSRNTTDAGNHDNKSMSNGIPHDKRAANKSENWNASNIECGKTEPKIHKQDELPHRWQTNEKTNIQRSKSYISMSSNAKYQTDGHVDNDKKYELHDEPDISMKKATSTTGLNIEVERCNEKFSQWRDNILKRQEEPTKEKQLQSLQVLKSILPQLKNAQQAEENVSKEYNNASLMENTRYEAGSNEHSIKTNVVSTRETRNSESDCKQSSREENTRRYTYAGPPAINLGSWSERPSVNVQIKMDTDYKLGWNNVSGNKTVVNINGVKDEKPAVNYTRIAGRNDVVKKEMKIDSATNKSADESARKSITRTTVSDFKKPIPNNVNAFDSMKDEDRPIVTGVELKKTFVQMREMPKNGEHEIDTTPVNFRELTKTFGQHLHFKPKPKRANVNRHSADCHSMQSDEIEKITDYNVKQNGHAKFAKASNQNDFSSKNQSLMNGNQQNLRTKKFTSIVGIYPTNQNNGPQNDMSIRSNINTMKINPPMPIVKGFKIPAADSKTNNNQTSHNGLSIIDSSRRDVQPPKPPTMPVITGVTLKSASTRPKSMPVQLDSRDILLESIRNFGGREKLRSAVERY